MSEQITFNNFAVRKTLICFLWIYYLCNSKETIQAWYFLIVCFDRVCGQLSSQSRLERSLSWSIFWYRPGFLVYCGSTSRKSSLEHQEHRQSNVLFWRDWLEFQHKIVWARGEWDHFIYSESAYITVVTLNCPCCKGKCVPKLNGIDRMIDERCQEPRFGPRLAPMNSFTYMHRCERVVNEIILSILNRLI